MTIRTTHIIDLDKLMKDSNALTLFNRWYESELKKDKCILQIIFISSKSETNYKLFVDWVFINTHCHVESGECDTLIFTDSLQYNAIEIV